MCAVQMDEAGLQTAFLTLGPSSLAFKLLCVPPSIAAHVAYKAQEAQTWAWGGPSSVLSFWGFLIPDLAM